MKTPVASAEPAACFVYCVCFATRSTCTGLGTNLHRLGMGLLDSLQPGYCSRSSLRNLDPVLRKKNW